MTVNFFKEYLSSHVSKEIEERGKKLFQEGKIINQSIDFQNNKGKFLVRGNGGDYDVRFSKKGEVFNISCSCPYNWSGICKHCVACIYELVYQVKIKEKSIPLRVSTSPFVIENHHPINKDLIFKYVTKQNYITQDDVDNISLDALDEGVVKFVLYNQRQVSGDVSVQFKLTDNQLNTSCNCKKKVAKLCVHQEKILLFLNQNKYFRNFFSVLNPGFIDAFKKNVCKEYGLPNNTAFSDYFTLSYVNGNLQEVGIKQGIGLVKLYANNQENNNNELSNLITQINKPSWTFSSEEKREHPNELRIGFALMFEKDSFFGEVCVIPLVGKPNKQGDALIAKICELETSRYLNDAGFTNNDTEIIGLSTQLKQTYKLSSLPNQNTFEDLIDQIKVVFPHIKNIITHLNKSPYTFISSDPGWDKIKKGDLKNITVKSDPAKLNFELFEEDKFIVLRPFLLINDEKIFTNDIKHPHLLFVEKQNSYYLINSAEEAGIYYHFIKKEQLKTSIENFEIFYDNFVSPLVGKFPIDMTRIKRVKNISLINKTKKKQVHISDFNDFVLFTPTVLYNYKIRSESLAKGDIINREKKNIIAYKRDKEFEQKFISFLRGLHPKFEKQNRTDYFNLPYKELLKGDWFLEVFEEMLKNDIEIFGLNKLKNFKYSPYKAKISSSIKSGQDWFEVATSIAFGNETISLNEVKKSIIKSSRFIKLSDGTLGLLPEEWVEKFKRYFKHGEINKDQIKISKKKFSIIEDLFEDLSETDIIKEIAEKKNRLQDFKNIKPVKKPQEIKADLRYYQSEGLSWLCFLNDLGWGGILADDMGLGKTLQVLCLLNMQKNNKKASLVVVPTTLLFNWENEIKKFCPELKAYFHYGNTRTSDAKEFNKHEVVFTSYGLMVNDIELIKKYTFNYIILDESQAIKNPDSKRFKASCLLKSKNKLAMTGTPIENNTFDLFAQMSFCNPGFLGTANFFKNEFSTPIDRDGNKEKAQELQKLVKPFILRRTKEQVATELPSKTEDIIYCKMDDDQRNVYDAYRNKYRDYLLNKIEEDGLGKAKIYVLEGLTKLRQICDSPALLNEKEDYGNSSIKIAELLRHVKNKTANHKTLVFSQFVGMLHLIKEELALKSFKFAYLDGSTTTKQRQEQVEIFQNDADCRVFLISLKAGGTGLNLTAADYVYLVDPWWNPAVENQAIDRCYRIGQKKKVIAYRMICKDTIEEKILQYQDQKRQISQEIIQADDSFVKKLSSNDIKDLFS